MSSYCSSIDVGQRLGLNSAQRTSASTRLSSAIRRAAIDIDQEFRDYGRNAPSRETAETTLDGAVAAGATTVNLTSGAAFSDAGNGNIDGDSFAWTGKSTNQLTGVTGITEDHLDDVTVQEGEMAHVLKEICADLAAAYYMEDEGTFFTGGESMRGGMLRERGTMNLRRLAHLGSVD
mgnify:FL=1|tara:strand:- start:350 stop:880 length:531 start_codon:yes stop_codon:yes gene_type:complete